MSEISKPQIYRDVIDELVSVCHDGQGQISARRVRSGVWNASATPDYLRDQHKINLLLTRLSTADRETLAQMLCEEVELGVFESLKALETFGISPFVDGYEGNPYHDFIGRLADWEWPEPNNPPLRQS